jgi:hypothetical protein
MLKRLQRTVKKAIAVLYMLKTYSIILPLSLGQEGLLLCHR